MIVNNPLTYYIFIALAVLLEISVLYKTYARKFDQEKFISGIFTVLAVLFFSIARLDTLGEIRLLIDGVPILVGAFVVAAIFYLAVVKRRNSGNPA